MNSALELVRAVETNGGRLWIEGQWLVIEPAEAGEPLAEELRRFKPEIMSLIRRWSTSESTGAMDDHDPAAWLDDFRQWIDANCIQRDRKDDWTGIGALHVDFCEWTVANDSVPCQRQVFERLVLGAGFRLNCGMTAGLLLRRDLEGHLSFERSTESVETARGNTSCSKVIIQIQKQ
jgi:hypothetical protein